MDQVYHDPNSDVFSNLQTLRSKISLIAPANPESWMKQVLGLTMMGENNTCISFPNTAIYMGFKFDDDMKEETAYKNLQEFVYYICNKDFENPRLSVMSDLHRHFPHPLDIKAGGLDIMKVIVTPEEEEEEEKDIEDGELGTSQFGKDRTGYILTPKHEDSSFKYGWILVVFNATSVTQIIRNGWGSWSMETLVRHLVRHGVEFRTLVPAAEVKPIRVVDQSPNLVGFTPTPRIVDRKLLKTAADYAAYVTRRRLIIEAPEAKPAFRMGGIIWRIAMESTGNFEDVIDHIMDGPSEVGPTKVDYFVINGLRYFDESVPKLLAEEICGVHGVGGC